MRFKFLKLRFRRQLRYGQQQVGDLGSQTEQTFERHFVRRLGHLKPVRRFVVGWSLLLVLLIGGVITQNVLLSNYYQVLRPVPGGIYSEGMLGTFTNANPLFATSNVDSSVSRLLFAGLFTYDSTNHLTGDLASSYSVDTDGTTYTVRLKPHLTWQDGQPLTSADVLFTYHLIQNADTQSPLQSSWSGITVTAPNPRTVTFKLPDPLASFPYNLTNGIVPQHLLSNIAPADLRSADFNTVRPVGAGPFQLQDIKVTGNDPNTAQEQIALVPFGGYQGGKPKLQEFIARIYASQDDLVGAFKGGQLNGVEGLDSVPAAVRHMSSLKVHSPLLTAATMAFFKTSSGVLSDQPVRTALVQATNTSAIIKSLGYATHAVNEPLLTGQLGYDPAYAQPKFDVAAARQALDADGWKVGKNGLRSKGGQPLRFTLTAANSPESAAVSRQLQAQWRAVGADVQLLLQNSGDFQNALTYHTYDAVLYGIAIGPDPDVFVYWDSSQADIRSNNRLNLSEYKNSQADLSLEAGRTRLDPTLRAVKYKPFLQAWQHDSPAVGLYQPRMLYLTNGPVAGFSDHSLNSAADRFNNVQNWEIRQGKVTN
ncbi:MAG TPA: ABC transporter substrate-binding protein [Candidatus Saccharimonadales bacterium]|nr:ABC transporter substrate-binding protein [Candidatus Saccharimonadales bacterium]